jgi:N-acetylmuramoyl-L-alanine amidase
MDPINDYANLSDLSLLALCVWREARGEGSDGKRGVGHVIRNRVYGSTHWWGKDWHSVILHPYQFSSFNADDPNSDRWPSDLDPSWGECLQAATPVYLAHDVDLTNGATFYYDTSISWPHAWGDQAAYENTLNVGRLKFWKLRPPVNNADDVRSIAAGD